VHLYIVSFGEEGGNEDDDEEEDDYEDEDDLEVGLICMNFLCQQKLKHSGK
jgi:hypothetical protein